jgi:hypothetical protein
MWVKHKAHSSHVVDQVLFAETWCIELNVYLINETTEIKFLLKERKFDPLKEVISQMKDLEYKLMDQVRETRYLGNIISSSAEKDLRNKS